MAHTPGSGRRRRWIARLLVLFSALCAAAFIGELSLRLLAPQPIFQAQNHAFLGCDWVLTLKPNSSLELPSEAPGETYRFTTNEFGFRNKPMTKVVPPDTWRVMIMGDSFTFGMAVDDGETYPVRVEEFLNANKGDSLPTYQVVNAGFASGFCPTTAAIFFRERGALFFPRIVIESIMVANDLADELELDRSEVEKEGVPETVSSRFRRVNDEGRWEWAKRVTPLAYRYPVLRKSHLFVLLANAISPPAVLAGNQQVADTNVIGEKTLDVWTGEALKRMSKSLRALQAMCSGRGAQFCVVLIPTRLQMAPGVDVESLEPQRSIRRILEEAGIPYVDLSYTFVGHQDLYYAHFNPGGCRLAGETVARFVLDSMK